MVSSLNRIKLRLQFTGWLQYVPPALVANSPAQEKIGSFCPLTRVLRASMAAMPVSMNSSGRARATG